MAWSESHAYQLTKWPEKKRKISLLRLRMFEGGCLQSLERSYRSICCTLSQNIRSAHLSSVYGFKRKTITPYCCVRHSSSCCYNMSENKVISYFRSAATRDTITRASDSLTQWFCARYKNFHYITLHIQSYLSCDFLITPLPPMLSKGHTTLWRMTPQV